MTYWYETPDLASAVADLEPHGLAADGDLIAPPGARRGEQTMIRYVEQVWDPAPTYDENGDQTDPGTDHGPHVWIYTTDPAVQQALDGAAFQHLAPSQAACPFAVAPEADRGQPALEDARAAKRRWLSAQADGELAAIRAEYPESEVLSWDKQEREARAVLADPQASTPLLSDMASIRGLTVSELAQRVVAKADQYTAAVASVVGKRQALDEQAQAAQSLAEIDAIGWDS